MPEYPRSNELKIANADKAARERENQERERNA